MWAFLEQPQLDWVAQGDEFFHLLEQEIAAAKDTTSTGGGMHTIPVKGGGGAHNYRRYGFAVSGLITDLGAFHRAADDWVLGVDAPDFGQAQAEAPAWIGAIRRAQARLGRTSEHRWWAIVAPTNEHSGAVVLEHGVTVADIRLAMPETQYERYRRSATPRGLGGGGTVEVTYPVVVRGSASGYESRAAMKQANDQLLRLCASLTLDTGYFWEVLESPQPYEWDPTSLPVSEYPLNDRDPVKYATVNCAATEVAEETFARMETDSVVANLAAAYYHAREIEEGSPSLATVIYVSVIEAIGSRFVPLTKCQCCADCNKSQGYARQFRKALREVLPRKEADRLGRLYEKRSKTAHEGTLHGTEFRLFAISNSFDSDPADFFFYQEVRHIRAAARGLLLKLVEDGLPEMEPATPE